MPAKGGLVLAVRERVAERFMCAERNGSDQTSRWKNVHSFVENASVGINFFPLAKKNASVSMKCALSGVNVRDETDSA